MSTSDLQRLTNDLENDPALADLFSEIWSDVEAVAQLASERGYSLTTEEAAGLCASWEELSDEDLEQVAGGWSGDGPP